MTQFPLGRRVRHDPRSLAYKQRADGTAATVLWQRTVPPFDQGQLGSCTGNAAVGVLATAPFAATMPAGFRFDEDTAVALYSAATKLDDDPDNYPPTDTGSSGLAMAQACKAAGLISGYTHITSVAAAMTAIQQGPFIVGTDWWERMFTPDPTGLVTIGGKVAGGHEYECVGYDVEQDRWTFCNSWGTSWGRGGFFDMSTATFTRLLAAQGDATVFVPVTQPAPTPTPTPAPSGPSAADIAALDSWAELPHIYRRATAAAKAWPRVKATL